MLAGVDDKLFKISGIRLKVHEPGKYRRFDELRAGADDSYDFNHFLASF